MSAANQNAERRLAERRRAPPQATDTPLVWIAAATLLGWVGWRVLAAYGVTAEVTFVAAIVALAGWTIAWLRRADEAGEALLLAAVALLAGGWADAAWRRFDRDDLGRYARREAEPVCLEAVVTGATEFRPPAPHSPFRAIPPGERTRVPIEVTTLRDAETWTRCTGRCEVTVNGRLADLEVGSRVRVFGQLRSPAPALNPGERDAAARERRERRLSLVWAEAPECVEGLTGELTTHATPFATLPRRARQALERSTDAPGAELLRAMVVGDLSGVSDRVIDSFRRVGVLHVLVVSGLHVGVGALLGPLLASYRVVGWRTGWLLSLGIVVLYVAAAGGRPPAMRAGCAAAVACCAALAGRNALGANSLAGAAVAVFASSPSALGGVGTQLSFGSASVLIAVAHAIRRHRAAYRTPLERLITQARASWRRRARRLTAGIALGLAATLGIQLVTFPLVWSEYHLFAPAAAPLTLVIALPLWSAIVCGLATVAAGAIGLESFAWLAGALGSQAAWSIGWLVDVAREWPWASIWVTGPSRWWIGAWFLWIAFVGVVWTYRWRASYALWAFAPVLVLGVAPLVERELARGDAAVRCSFIAVGHGAATLLETPHGGTVLIDSGALGEPDRAADTIARVLWERGLVGIDVLVLTHADVDHYNAAPGLLERFDIDAVWTSRFMFPRFLDPLDRTGPAELARILRLRGVPVRALESPDRLTFDGVTFEVLHPDRLGAYGSDNANSLVLGVEFAGRRVLAPADLAPPGLEILMGQERYDCDLLLAPHHGSARSDPPGFAAWCRPEHVVVSSGAPPADAAAAYRRRGARVWSTHERGMITARMSAEGVFVAGARD